jgi:hypothetical protein
MNFRLILVFFLPGVALSAGGGETPEILADPEALRQVVPRLKEQRHWTEFATPEQVALFAGPQTVWPVVPESAYDLAGFDPASLGSPLPPPGVHPRLFFSPADVPQIARQLKASERGRRALLETDYALSKTLWDPASDEGRIFAKLATGDLTGLEWPENEGKTLNLGNAHYFRGYKQTLRTTVHEGYFPHLLSAAALWCLLENDAERGTRVAAALANYYRLREPLIDALNREFHEQKLAPNDQWRPMHNMVGNAGLAFGYDCAAPWMTEEQKTVMRRVIAKATSGKRAYGMNGPTRWRDTNWVGWDLQHFLTAMAIEGEEGYDPEIYPVARDTVRAFLDWGISDRGVIYETNGKNGAGLQNAFLSMVVLARHGENFFGHPHLRKLPAAQVQTYAPGGGTSFNNGTWGNALFWPDLASMLKGFYPQDACADWLLRQDPETQKLPAPDYLQLLQAKADKLPVPKEKLPVLTLGYLFGKRDPSGPAVRPVLPQTFSDPGHGLLAARADDTPESLYLHFEARPNLRGVGHQHHDSGQFYLAALGELWAVEAGAKNSYSSDHNTVLIDGRGHADVSAAPRVNFLGVVEYEHGAIVAADLQNAYNYGWTSPMHFSWLDPAVVSGQWQLSPDTDPELVAYYRGTQKVKMRIWGGNYWDNNWGPTMRIAGNPVQSAFRTAALVRGPRPYALIVDDRNKDGREHDYAWLMQVPDTVRMLGLALGPSVPAVALVKSPPGDGWRSRGPGSVARGEPALLVCLLDAPTKPQTTKGNHVADDALPYRMEQITAPAAQPGQSLVKNRFLVTRRAVNPRFKILLLPFRGGDKLPVIRWEEKSQTATLTWPDQTDTLVFTRRDDDRTTLSVRRGDELLLSGEMF